MSTRTPARHAASSDAEALEISLGLCRYCGGCRLPRGGAIAPHAADAQNKRPAALRHTRAAR